MAGKQLHDVEFAAGELDVSVWRDDNISVSIVKDSVCHKDRIFGFYSIGDIVQRPGSFAPARAVVVFLVQVKSVWVDEPISRRGGQVYPDKRYCRFRKGRHRNRHKCQQREGRGGRKEFSAGDVHITSLGPG